jgi:hypothetical protein
MEVSIPPAAVMTPKPYRLAKWKFRAGEIVASNPKSFKCLVAAANSPASVHSSGLLGEHRPFSSSGSIIESIAHDHDRIVLDHGAHGLKAILHPNGRSLSSVGPDRKEQKSNRTDDQGYSGPIAQEVFSGS